MKVKFSLPGGSRKPRCRKGKPCGSVCIPRRSKCDEEVLNRKQSREPLLEKGSPTKKKAKPVSSFDEKKYQAALFRRGFMGGGAAVAAISVGAGLQITHDLKKIQPDTSRPDPPHDYDSLVPGDLVRRKSVLGGVTAYHYAVYAGKDEKTGEHYVVHTQAADKKNQEAGSVVVRTPIEKDKDPFFRVPEGEMYKKEQTRKISPEEALARAERMVGKSFTYSLFSSNCESFARAVVEGAAYTSQGEAVSPLTRNLLDFFVEAAFATTRRQYLRSKNRMNSKEILDFLDAGRAVFRGDARDAANESSALTKMKHDFLNTLNFRGIATPPGNEVDAFCDQIGMKRPDDYYALVETLARPLGSTRKAVRLKMIADYTKMIMGVINSDVLLAQRTDSFSSFWYSAGGRHPPPVPIASSSFFHRKIRSDSLVMNKSIASLSLSDIAMEISASHDIAVDEIYDTEIRTDGSLAGIASSGGTFFEFDINSRSVGVVERPDLTASANERARGSLSAMGIDYRGDSAFEYLRGLESRMDGPFGAVRRVAGGQCGRGWKPGPGGKCVRGGGMGRGAKIGAGIAAVGALGAGAVALNRARKPKVKALPSSSGSAIVPYSATAWKNPGAKSGAGAGMKSASPNAARRLASGIGNRVVGAVSGAKNRIGSFAQKFRKPPAAPAPRRESPGGAITVASRRVDSSTRMDGPFGAVRRVAGGQCGRGWKPGPGGKCVRGGGMGRGAKIGAGIAAVGALGAGAVALNRARKPKVKALPSSSGSAIVPYSATAWKNPGAKPAGASSSSGQPQKGGRVRQGIQKGVGRVKNGVQKVRDVAALKRANSKKMPGTGKSMSSYTSPRH